VAHKRGVKTELGGVPTPRRTVTFDDLTLRLLRVLGHGNASQGVRTAARMAYALRNTVAGRAYFTPSKTTDSLDAQGLPPSAASPAPQPLQPLQPDPPDAARG